MAQSRREAFQEYELVCRLSLFELGVKAETANKLQNTARPQTPTSYKLRFNLAAREVIVAIVHCFELAAIDGYAGFSEERLSWRHSSTNWAQTLRMDGPLSLQKSAITLSSGDELPKSDIHRRLRLASRSSLLLECTRFR